MTDIAGTSMYEFLKYALHWIYEFVTRSAVNSDFMYLTACFISRILSCPLALKSRFNCISMFVEQIIMQPRRNHMVH